MVFLRRMESSDFMSILASNNLLQYITVVKLPESVAFIASLLRIRCTFAYHALTHCKRMHLLTRVYGISII